MDQCKKCVLKNCVKVFPEGGEFVNITDPEGGPTATGMILESGIVHSVSSGKVEMFLCAACHAFTPHVNAWKR